MRAPALLRIPLALARRASVAIRRALAVPLLAIAYVLVVPGAWLWLRLRGARPGGWRARGDRDVGTLDRLRQPF